MLGKFWKWIRKLPCRIGVHDWRDGPGSVCAVLDCRAVDEVGLELLRQVIREGIQDAFAEWRNDGINRGDAPTSWEK